MSGSGTSTRPARFQTVTEEFVPDGPVEQPLTTDAEREESKLAASLLMFSLKALSQRTIIALSNLFTLLTAASVFALACLISASPSIPQLVELGLYGGFVLLLHFVRRK